LTLRDGELIVLFMSWIPSWLVEWDY